MITFRELGKLGRFGNQMFQYASARLYAEHHGYSWAFPDWIGVELFEGMREWTFAEHARALMLPTVQTPDFPWLKRRDKIAAWFGRWQMRSLLNVCEHPFDNFSFYGYLQEPHAFLRLAREKNKVLKYFQFKKEIEDAYRAATAQYGEWVGVHIRRGDYVKRGLIMPLEPYKEILRSLPAGTNVFVSSDDPAVVDEFKEFNLIRPNDPKLPIWQDAFDFWMLARSRTLLGCGSTFSWWAAYLGNRNDYWGPPLLHLWPAGIIPPIEKIPV